MPGDVKDEKLHAAAKPADGDLTCSESQIEDILSEGESNRPISKSDKGLHQKRQPRSSQ